MKTGKDKLMYPQSLDELINYMIYRTARVMRMKFQRDMNSIGLDITQEQYFILIKLWERDGQYQVELADEIFQDNPNITRILDNLEKKELITRKADTKDRRKFRIFLTKKGKELHGVVKKNAPKARKSDYEGLDNRDFEEVKRVLNNIEKNILKQSQSE